MSSTTRVVPGGKGRRGRIVQTRVLKPARRPRKPAHLGPEGTSKWTVVWKECEWLTSADVSLVTRLCEAMDTRQALRRRLDKDGYFSEGAAGQIVQHPGVMHLARVDRQINQYEATLGVGPYNRARLKILVDDPNPTAKPKARRRPAPEGWHWNAAGTAIEED